MKENIILCSGTLSIFTSTVPTRISIILDIYMNYSRLVNHLMELLKLRTYKSKARWILKQLYFPVIYVIIELITQKNIVVIIQTFSVISIWRTWKNCFIFRFTEEPSTTKINVPEPAFRSSYIILLFKWKYANIWQ